MDIKAIINKKEVKISAKGGIIKNNILSVSSYRLTSFNNLRDKLNFVKQQHINFDFYLICAREVRKDQTINYLVIKTSPTKLAPPAMLDERSWKRTKNGYELKGGTVKFNAKIVSKMSDQLWYSIPLSYFSDNEKIVNVSISKKELGKGLVDFLAKNSK